jgi:hypothetical protein
MAWGRIDDHAYRHRKFKLAWDLEPASVGLEFFALSYSNDELTDGAVDEQFVHGWFPRRVARERRAVDALLEAGLWVPNGAGWQIHDFLEYNDPAEEVKARRQAKERRRRENRRVLQERQR